MSLIDSHCHLDFSVFDADREAILQRCAELGIEHLIVPAVSQQSWSPLLTICSDSPQLHPALGLHPMFMQEHQPDDINALATLLEQIRPVAVGEIGLDFFLPGHDKPTQTALFEAQIELAQHFELPVILHVRKAHDQVLKVLRRASLKGGIVHAFNGSMQQADFYMQQNFKFGVGGALTYPRAQKLQRLFSELPMDAIVLETDAPDMPLAGHQGERNSPEHIPLIAEKLAELRHQPVSAIAAATTSNCKALFQLQ